jgi:hypothetical protein
MCGTPNGTCKEQRYVLSRFVLEPAEERYGRSWTRNSESLHQRQSRNQDQHSFQRPKAEAVKFLQPIMGIYAGEVQ